MGTSKLSLKPDEMLGVTCDGLASHPGGVAILLVASSLVPSPPTAKQPTFQTHKSRVGSGYEIRSLHSTETGISSGSNGPPGS